MACSPSSFVSAWENQPGLADLPGEMIASICTHLTPLDTRNLRLVCRGLNGKSYRPWGVAHFGSTPFILTTDSLAILMGLSKDTRYGPCIKDLQLCLVTFPPQEKVRINGDLSQGPVHAGEDVRIVSLTQQTKDTQLQEKPTEDSIYNSIRRRRRRNYNRIWHDQNKLRKQAIDVQKLTEIVQNLGGLESISVVDRYHTRSPPWGLRKIQSEIGFWPDSATCERKYGWMSLHDTATRKAHWEFSTHAIAVCLGALLKSGKRLKGCLSLDGAPYQLPLPKDPTRRRLTPASTPAKTFADSLFPDLAPALADLKNLTVNTYSFDRQDLIVHGHDTPLVWLLNLIPIMPAVETLEIGGAFHERETYIFRNILSSPDIFPRLRRLYIHSIFFEPYHVIKFLHNHSTTLESFESKYCFASRPTKHEGDYYHILPAIRGFPALKRIRFVGAKSWSWSQGGYSEDIRSLEGLGVSTFEISEDSPEHFQKVLEATLSNRGELPPALTWGNLPQ